MDGSGICFGGHVKLSVDELKRAERFIAGQIDNSRLINPFITASLNASTNQRVFILDDLGACHHPQFAIQQVNIANESLPSKLDALASFIIELKNSFSIGDK